MYFNLDWEIYFKNEVENKVYRLGLLLECEIEKNVENLADIATITLPESDLNEVLDFNKKMPEQAGPLYIEIFNKAGTQIKNTTEALYVADYLYRIGNHEDIKVILDEVGCEIFMDKNKTKQCFTYLGKEQ